MASIVFLVCGLVSSALPGADDYVLGRKAELHARYADAIGYYDACTAKNGPLAFHARIRAGVARARAGDPEGGARGIESLLAAVPEGSWRALASHELALLYAAADRRPEAATLFDRAHEARAQIWWLNDVRWIAAENLLEVDGEGDNARAFFRDVAQHSSWSKKRRDAALVLGKSPHAEDRLLAAMTLIVVGASEEALPILTPLQDLVQGRPDLEPAWMRAQGRLDLVRGRMRTGRERLWEVVERYPDAEASHDALGDLVRHYARRDEFADAERALTLLAEIDPTGRRVLAARRNLARAYAGDRRTDAAVSHYEFIARVSRSDRDVRRVLLGIAQLLRKSDRTTEAIAYFDRVAQRFPATSEGIEGAYWAATLLHAAGVDEAEVVARYRAAVRHGLTQYYGYRALDALANLGDRDASRARRLKVTAREPVVRPMKQDFARPVSARAILASDVRVERLTFFTQEGYDEAEWEALAIGNSLEGHADPGGLYAAMGEAGTTAYTAMQFANAFRFGVDEDGHQSIARLRVRYPLAYWEFVKRLGKELPLDPYLILSVARQESTYRPGLESNAGAAGIMQLMPATARWLVEKDPRLNPEMARRLTNPANSLRLGGFYLRRMLDRYEGNVVYALAAYNAGPSNCDSWRRNFRGETLDEFVEEIPFTETRNYVKRVLANYATYYSIYPPPE